MIDLTDALLNIIKNQNPLLGTAIKSKTRANAMGDSFEEYIKMAFSNSFNCLPEEKIKNYSKVFSWQGTQNNPPDIIIKNSDAIEVKKMTAYNDLALNSSYPKSKLSSRSRMITDDCRQCESGAAWDKDLIYTVGTVKGNKIESIFFVYGDLYAADENHYSRIQNFLKDGIEHIPGIAVSETKELAKIKQVDPLGITDLRVRGMWSIQHPAHVFDYIDSRMDKNSKFTIYALIGKNKYQTLNKANIKQLSANLNVSIKFVKVKSPNNPSNLLEAVFIKVIM